MTRKPVGRPTKSTEEHKQDFIRVRVSAEQKKILTEAAAFAGLDVSSWLRSAGLQMARAAR